MQGGEVSDNCAEVSVEHLDDDTNGDTCPQTITRTYRVVDACGNETSCDQIITVDDEIDPFITCPSNLDVQCMENVPPAAQSLQEFQVQGGVAFDNCEIETFEHVGDVPDGQTCPMTIVRTYRVVEFTGRWGMLDVLLVTLLIAVVKLGDVVQVAPGPAALAFTAVVVLSLLAAATFDPHALWEGDA